MPKNAYDELITHVKELALLQTMHSSLDWDQEVLMPHHEGAVAYRAKQLSLLAKLSHERQIDPRVDVWLKTCEKELKPAANSPEAVNLREIRRTYDRATKLPTSLVIAFSETTAQAKHYWSEARKADNYALFAPWLEKIVKLNRERAACWGWKSDGEAWDALADEYEKGLTAKDVAALFTPLRKALVDLLPQVLEKQTAYSSRLSEVPLPIEVQKRFVNDILKEVGFDLARGRLDTSTHPFCSTHGPHDVRLTTRFRDNLMTDALGSTLHEGGHGIYEQHLPDGQFEGTPFGSHAGLAVHESQSRIIENQVGRSHAFWSWCHPKLREYFGEAVKGISADEAYQSVNRVKPSLIRVEADEVTYNLHVMIRFELERALMDGSLSVQDLPQAWNDKYRDYLNLKVPSNKLGCLQDIHWSMGAMGYFPTYTIGNLLAAQLFQKAQKDVPGMVAGFEKGEFQPFVSWLNEKVHKQGGRYPSKELCQFVCGQPLGIEAFVGYLKGKFLG